MIPRLRLPAALLAFSVLLTTGLGGIATIAQPTSAWFSDVAVVPWSIAVGDVDPVPDPPAGPEIPWTGQGDEHMTLECDGPVHWDFNLTGNLAGIDATLTATFATAGDIGPVDMQQTGGQPNGALQVTITTPKGDTLEVAVASLNATPKKKTLLVLSSSSCEPESDDEPLETMHVTSEANDEPAQRDTHGSDDAEEDIQESSSSTVAPGDAEPKADDPRAPADPEAVGPDEDDLDPPDADDHPGEGSADLVESGDATADTSENSSS